MGGEGTIPEIRVSAGSGVRFDMAIGWNGVSYKISYDVQ